MGVTQRRDKQIRARPKTRWRDFVNKALKMVGLKIDMADDRKR